MKTHEFTLVLMLTRLRWKRISFTGSAATAPWRPSPGCPTLNFHREAACLEDAIRSALDDVRAAGFTVQRGRRWSQRRAAAHLNSLTAENREKTENRAIQNCSVPKRTFAERTVYVPIPIPPTEPLSFVKITDQHDSASFNQGTMTRKVKTRGTLAATALVFVGFAVAGKHAEQQPSKEPAPLFSFSPPSIAFGAAFSPDGSLLAVACNDKSIIIYNMATGKQRMVLRGHAERVWSVAFSLDGKTLISGSGEYRKATDPGEVKVWEIDNGKERASLPGHRGLVFGVAFSPDGKTAASASWDGTVKLWDFVTAKEKAILSDHKEPVRNVAFSPDGKLLASISFDGTAVLWDTATWQKRQTMQAHAGGVQALAIAPLGRFLQRRNGHKIPARSRYGT